jgi:hypothetical protein
MRSMITSMPGCICARKTDSAAKPTPPASARSGGGSVIRLRFALDDVGPAAKGAIQLDDLVGVRALLRCIHARRAQRTIQRVVDIDGESE